jgi:hypothetical protein
MNEGYPPLLLPSPERRQRRSEKPRFVPLPPELFARRAEIAEILGAKVSELSNRLRRMSEGERRAVFYKLEHEPDHPVRLDGTGLKVIAHPADDITYAIPRKDSLDKLAEKIAAFGAKLIREAIPANQSFAYLKDITAGDPIDRLSPELQDKYGELIAQDHVICEIEFLSLKAGRNQRRDELAAHLQDLRAAFRAGVNGSLFEHEIALPTCKAVIRCTGSFLRTLVEDPFWIERIRWFEARPKFQTFNETLQEFKFEDLKPVQSPPGDAPVVCVVDSGVTAGNPFLSPVTRVELLQSYLASDPNNPNDEYGHGSAVASLASYYALKLAPDSDNKAKVWIACARILNADNSIEEGRLFSALLREVVEDFTKVGVRIFCLAVGDESKRWNEASKHGLPRKSWVARTIDQLSHEYDVIFVTCTGNINLAELRDLLAESGDYPKHFKSDEARLLDPSQAALALTVGSIARGTQMIASAAVPLAMPHQPSPFTRCGPGIRRDCKPELVEYGGNLAYDESLNRPLENHGLMVVAASHELTPAIKLFSGTSFAAPRVAHRLALVLKDLESLGVGVPSAPLLKAFLVNSAIYPTQGESSPREAFDAIDRSLWVNVAGYGVPDENRATYGDEYSVVLHYDGEIESDQVLFFDVPVPKDLAVGKRGNRITVTVCHYPEVQRWGLERYLAVDLKWRLFRGNVNRDDVVEAMSAEVVQSDEELLPPAEDEQSEDVEMPSELKCVHGINRRSRGTVQHDIYEWQRHKSEYSDSHYTLAVTAYKRDREVKPFRIAVVIRIEDLGQTVPIYAPVRQILETEARIGTA